MNPNQQTYFQNQGFQNMQPNKQLSQPQQQLNSMNMGMNQYPNQMYQQQVQPNIQQQQPFIQQQQQVNFGNNPYSQYPTNYGNNISGPSSLNTSISTDYSEINGGEFEKVIEHIANLKYPEKREEALQELSKKRESFPKLAVYLWHSVGTLAIL